MGLNKLLEHLPGYPERDIEIVDYKMYTLANTDLWFRGPQLERLKPGEYIACIGAAQTFGCLCKSPFPALLQQELNFPVLNLGYGGAGPYFFLKHRELLNYINQAKFVIVQVMSGRSESNSMFDSGGLEYLIRRSDGKRLGADVAYKEVLEGSYFWNVLPIKQKYVRRIAKVFGSLKARLLVSETRRNWINNYRCLLNQIHSPKILLWFSQRTPNYREMYRNLSSLFNKYPQLVNSKMVEGIVELSDEYVECVTKRGIPQPLLSRFTGEPAILDPSIDRKDLGGKVWTHNSYYPSPEMHIDAAKLLLPFCRKYLA